MSGMNRRKVNIKKMTVRRMLAMKFAKIVGTIVGVSLVIVSVAAYGYVVHANNVHTRWLTQIQASEDEERARLIAEAYGADIGLPPELAELAELTGDMRTAPTRTTFLLVGLDDVARLADTIIAGVFNHNTLEISLISIPRDTFVQLSSATVREMQTSGGFPPSHGGVRINAVQNYTRDTQRGIWFLREEVETLLGFYIDYYFVMNLAGFRDIVDALGGVTVNVPMRMFYNPYDQPLVIDLQPGVQHLNGMQAEGFVRFRNHPAADLFRIQNQQQFMSALFSQALTRENIINNAFEIAGVLLTHTTTNFGITDIPRYVRYITSLNPERLEAHSLPSARPAGSFFWHDPVETMMLVEGIFWDGELGEDGERIFRKEDMGVTVLNGGAVSGLAGTRQAMLLENGFARVDAENFYGTRRDETRIIAFREEAAQVVAAYFPQAVIELATTQTRGLLGDNDVAVVIGLAER